METEEGTRNKSRHSCWGVKSATKTALLNANARMGPTSLALPSQGVRCLSGCLVVPLPACLPGRLSVCLCDCMSLCLSACALHKLVLFVSGSYPRAGTLKQIVNCEL